jgi:hypothetical protein
VGYEVIHHLLFQKHGFLYMFDYYIFLIGKFGNCTLSFVMLNCYINLERVGFDFRTILFCLRYYVMKFF